MTPNDIYECFKDDVNLLLYYDPEGSAKNNLEASMEIYGKLVEYSLKRKCVFKKIFDMGYIFYYKKRRLFFAEKVLVSFCVKPAYRNREYLEWFGDIIKMEIGDHFKCYLYNKNTRAIKFLEKIGMKTVRSNNLITLLSI